MISLRDVVTGFGNRDPLAEVWRRSLRGGGGGSAVITGVPPLRYIGNGRPLTDYLISGNALQDGTPSPDAPVDAVGCGTDTASGYKLPLTVNGTEYPIYLGQVETTRRIKKLVLTGEETTWNYYENATGTVKFFYLVIARIVGVNLKKLLNTHGFNMDEVTQQSGNILIRVYAVSEGIGTVEEWKACLAAQYAAGTPVTVWYVLAEPETAVVNEPLMKIGDYADTISFAQAGVAIPTVNGANVLDVPTEVPPSEVTIKGGIRSV